MLLPVVGGMAARLVRDPALDARLRRAALAYSRTAGVRLAEHEPGRWWASMLASVREGGLPDDSDSERGRVFPLAGPYHAA